MKKFISILIVLALCVSLCAVASAEEDWTIFVYLCGADLESENSMATGNMQQMIDANTGPNVRFVVETGGASSWHNGANPDMLDRYLVTGGSSTLVDSQPSASMGKAETLADFLRWGLAAYPASHMGLVLWDHGSGSINGVCFDELNDDESLYLTDLDKALKSVQGSLPNGFDFIGFDACLMSTVETAAMLAPYARYMVASEEVEPGSGWDYAAIGRYLNANPSADGAAAGKAICDSYYDSCVSNDDEDTCTLAVTDLSKIDALRTAFDAYAKDLFDATEAGADYAPIARAIAAADNFGGNNRSEGYTNMVDLAGLITAGGTWSKHAQATLSALNDAVIYQVLGGYHKQAGGLAVYYPLSVQGSMELGIFKDICVSSYYLGLVNKVAFARASGGSWDEYDENADDWNWDDAALEDGQSTAISFDQMPGFDENGVYGFVLSQAALNNTESVEAILYLISEDEEDCISIGYTSDVWADWDTGVVEDNFDGYWFSLPDGQNLCIYLVDEYDGYDIFTTPVRVNGQETNLRFSWEYNTGKVQVLGLWDGINDNGIASRPSETLKAGDRIVPLYDAFSMTTDEEFQYYGEEYVWKDGDELYFEMLMDGDYLYAFCINDIYGGSYLTDFVMFSVDGEQITYTDAA